MRFLAIFLVLFSLCFASDKGTDEKIKAMIMLGLGKNADFSALSHAKYVIVFARDFNTSDELKTLSAKLHKMGLKIAIDEEGGKVSRLAKLGIITPSPKELSQISNKNDDETPKKAYAKMTMSLKDFNIDINFAPVVDIHSQNSPIIGALNRAFSSEAKQVIKMAKIFINEHEKMGILTCLKHFVGHGLSTTDTHKSISEALPSKAEIEPFRALIQEGLAKSIMLSHLKIKNIDKNTPATLSKAVGQDFLRGELGFDGLVFSDDMQMAALADFSLEQKILGFLKAGGDVLIFANYNEFVSSKEIFEIIKNAVLSGKISKERIDESYRRIQRAFKSR